MSLVGKEFGILNEETGDITAFVFNDTPLIRFMSGLTDACQIFGLTPEETIVLSYFWLAYSEKINGITALIPPVLVRGVEQLTERGWMSCDGQILWLRHNRDTDAIFKAANASIKFGESEGTA